MNESLIESAEIARQVRHVVFNVTDLTHRKICNRAAVALERMSAEVELHKDFANRLGQRAEKAEAALATCEARAYETAAKETIENVLRMINHSEETAALAEPGWETGYAAALRVMDSLIRGSLAPAPVEEKD